MVGTHFPATLARSQSSRRDVLTAIAATGAVLIPNRLLAASPDGQAMPEIKIIARGLLAPEGPKVLPNGQLIVCEMARATLTRVEEDGSLHVIASLGGAPNGVAIDDHGNAYVCNNGGGFHWERHGELLVTTRPPDPGARGSIQKVDLETGEFSVLYNASDGKPLQGPNDIVFDSPESFWFTDLPGGAVYWARTDGSEIRTACNLSTPNGIALSPDRMTLYVAQTRDRQISAFRISNPGHLVSGADGEPDFRIINIPAEGGNFDSMAVEDDGGLVAATLHEGCLSLFGSDGLSRGKVSLPETLVTNLTFGGDDMRTVYVTLTTTGILASVRWPRPGLRLAAGRDRAIGSASG